MRDRLLSLAAAFLLAACATAGPQVAHDPCQDPAYRALKAQPVDSLSEREFKQLQQGDAACAQVQAVLAATANDAPRPREVRMETDAYTQSMQNDVGMEIFIRNRGNVPIMVTSVTLTSCVNIRDFCGTTHPRVRINPGDARRVMRVRYREDGPHGTFQYTYRVEPADPAQN